MEQGEKVLSEQAYGELQTLLTTHYQVLVNKDYTPRDLYRANVSQCRDFEEVSLETVQELVEKLESPFFVLNNFAGGDVGGY